MHGDLSETSAADACRELAASAATGALALDGPDGPGRVVFVQGRVVAAASPTPRARLGDRLVGAGLLDDDALTQALQSQSRAPEHTRLGALLVEQGLVSRDAVRLFVQEQVLDALFDVLRWRYGLLEFAPGDPDEVPEVPLSIPVDEVLVEIARRQQEWDELSRVIPHLDVVPAFGAGGSTATAALEPDEFAVLASVDGHRSIRELAADLGYGEFEAARIVYGLALLGVVEVRLPEDEVGAALDDAFAYGADPPELPTLGARRPRADDEVLGAEPHRGDRAGDAAAHPREPVPTAGDGAGGPTGADAPPGADPPPAHDEPGQVIEADLPPPAHREVGAFFGGGATAPGTDDDAAAGRAGETPADAPDPQEGGGTEATDATAAPGGARDSGDVSEFLRELSRLALDDTSAAPRRGDGGEQSPQGDPPPRGEPRPSQPDDSRRRRRGLFGRGG